LILRLATVEDLSELYMMLMVMHSGTVDGTSPVNSEKLTTAINNALHRGVVIVAEVNGKLSDLLAGWKRPTGGPTNYTWLTCGFLCIKSIENQERP